MTLAQQVSAYQSTRSSQTNRKRTNTFSIPPSSSPYDSHGYLQESSNLSQPKPRRATLSQYSYLPASTPDNIESAKSGIECPVSYHPSLQPNDIIHSGLSPRGESIPTAPSPAPSSSGSSTSSKVQFSDAEDQIKLGQDPPRYAPRTPQSPPKTVLKNEAKMPSLFDENHPIFADLNKVNNITHTLITYVKEFKCPSELDFSVNTGSPLILANVTMNKSFIQQLRKLDGLRSNLADTPTYGNEDIEAKQRIVSMSIRRALGRMKEKQLELYQQFQAVESALDDAAIDLNDCIKQFEYPSKLDFSSQSEDGLILLNTERNKPFIDQLRRLDWFREELNEIPNHSGERLQHKRKVISHTLGKTLERMKEHQLELYRRQRTKRDQHRRN
ncbi:hypothetical protein OPQ81_004052 [Rhizoctonia solani]|nr:hypothetical protein OPQ81_004052 [Rhizoctonia solani]